METCLLLKVVNNCAKANIDSLSNRILVTYIQYMCKRLKAETTSCIQNSNQAIFPRLNQEHFNDTGECISYELGYKLDTQHLLPSFIHVTINYKKTGSQRHFSLMTKVQQETAKLSGYLEHFKQRNKRQMLGMEIFIQNKSNR